jgi:hypothetical protein
VLVNKPSSARELPVALREQLERLLDLIRSDTVKREMWANRFTTADRRKFTGTAAAVLERHHTIDLWHVARGTPTWNECIVEVAHAVGLIGGPQREALLAELGARPPADRSRSARSGVVPRWNDDARELRFRRKLVRTVKRPKQAHNIVTILRAFEAAGWPQRIDDPHGRKPNDETRRRDVSNLNAKLDTSLLKFECDGTGTGFLWRAVSGTAKKPARRKRR